MPSYDTPESVARLLADIKLDILDSRRAAIDPEGADTRGTFAYTGTSAPASDKINYTVSLIRPQDDKGLTFDILDRNSTPTIGIAMSCVLSDTMLFEGIPGLDEFADENPLLKPSEAIAAYDELRRERDWVRDTLCLSRSEINEILDTLDGHAAEVESLAQDIQRERAEAKAYENPPVPEGFVTIEELQGDLDLGDWGDQTTDYGDGYISDVFSDIADANVDIYNSDLLEWLPTHTEWMETAYDNGQLEGCGGDIYKMIRAAQEECFRSDLYGHKSDIIVHHTLDDLKKMGAYAIEADTATAIIDRLRDAIDEEDSFDDFTSLVTEDVIHDRLEKKLGEELAFAIGDRYDKPNPFIMGKEAVREVNRDGYDEAFKNAWKDLVSTQDAPTGHKCEGVSLASEAKDCRAASNSLAQGDAAPAPRQAER